MSARSLIRLLLLAFAVILVGTAATVFYLWKEERRAQRLVHDAFTAFTRGDQSTALDKYTAALDARLTARDRALAYSGRGAVYLAQGKSDQAIADLDQAIRLAPQVGELFSTRGDAYRQKGGLDRALADYTRAIALSPNYFPAFLRRGNLFLQRNQADAALGDFNEAVRIEPENPEALQDRGNAYLAKHDVASALANFEALLRLVPEKKLLLRDGLKQRIAALKDTIASDLREKGVRSFQAGRFEEAIRFDDEALAYAPGAVTASTVLTNRANAHRLLGQTEKAFLDYDEAIRLNPDATLAHFNRATTALGQGKIEEALRGFEEVLRQRPTYAPALLDRAQILVKRGQLQKANADFEAALEHLEEVNPSQRLRTIEQVARIRATSPFAILRNGLEAVELASALCLRTQRKNSKSLDTLAAAYAETGLFDQAIDAEKQALELNDMPAGVRQEMTQRLELYRRHQPLREPHK